jgi:hypothetical protein
MCDIPLESFQWGLQLCFRPHCNRSMHVKLWAPKVAEVLAMGILGFPLGNPGTKSHLDVAPVERCKVYYKGEGGGFPQVWAVVNLVSMSCLWFILAPKVLQVCNNHLGFVQVCVSSWSLSIVPSPIPELQHAPLPLQSAANQGACPNSLLFHCFQFGTHIWPPQGVGSVS